MQFDPGGMKYLSHRKLPTKFWTDAYTNIIYFGHQ